MGDSLVSEIQLFDVADGVRYVLPRRPLGAIISHAQFLLVMIGVCLGIAILEMLLLGRMFGRLAAHDPTAWLWFSGLLLLPSLPLGFLVGIRRDLFLLTGHSEIILSAGKLQVLEKVGPVCWTRRRFMEDIGRLDVSSVWWAEWSRWFSWCSFGGALTAECQGAKPLQFAHGYPARWLKALAADLSRRLELVLSEAPSSAKGSVVQTWMKPPGFCERSKQPANSKALLERYGDEFTLTLPPAGIWCSSKGVLVWGTLMCGFLVVLGVVVISGTHPWWGGRPTDFLVSALILVLGAATIKVLFRAVTLGRTQTVLAVVADTVMVLQTNLFGTTRREWIREQIADIRTGPTGHTTGPFIKLPIIELQICPKDGKKYGMLAGREVAELQWIATILRGTLTGSRRDERPEP